MRRGFDRLAQQAEQVTGVDPLSGHLFVFRNRRGDKLKVLLWDRDGYVLIYKRLEEGVFKLPPPEAGRESVALRPSELAMLLDGIDLSSIKRGKRYRRRVTGAAKAP
jgi:transposase